MINPQLTKYLNQQINMNKNFKSIKKMISLTRNSNRTNSLADNLVPNSTKVSRLNTYESIQKKYIYPVLDHIYSKGESLLQKSLGLENKTGKIEELELSQYRSSEVSPNEQRINRHLTESTLVLFANSIAAIVYPPLMLLSFPFVLKDTISIVQCAVDEFKYERKFGVTGLIALGNSLLFLQGMWWIFALYNVLFLASEKFLFKTRDTSQRNLADFFGGLPRTVWCEKDGIEIEVSVEDIQVDDRVIVHAGEMIAIDGLIVSGFGTIDQHMLTGEAQPVEKTVGDTVYAGTVALSGTFTICVQKAGRTTVSGQIAEVLNSTADYRSVVELRGEKIANASVLPTLALSALAFSLLGPISATALLSCFIGFQLRYTSPLSILNFLQIAVQEGILIKDGRALELLANVDTIVFDKTGTLTLEELSIDNIHAFTEYTPTEVLRYAAAAEYKQSHPIALAILQTAQTAQVQVPSVVDAAYTTGFGLSVSVQDASSDMTRQVLVGSQRYMEQQQIILAADSQAIQAMSASKGHSVVYVTIDNQLAGIIELRPTIRPEAREVLHALKERGLSLYIISGDQEQPTAKLAETLGIEHYFAQVLPEDKANLVEKLQAQGKSVCFIGDGINDSIALKKANTSISLKGATSMAMDAAQMILMDGTLAQLPMLFHLSDQLESNMRRNFMAGTIPGVICLGGVFFLHFGVLIAGALSWAGLSLGIANAMMPLLNYQKPAATRHNHHDKARTGG